MEKEKILNMSLQVLNKEKKEEICNEINEMVKELDEQKFTMEELELLDEITKMQVEENTSNIPILISIISLVVTFGFAMNEVLRNLLSDRTNLLVGNVILAIIVVIVGCYACYEMYVISKAAKRNQIYIRRKTAIEIYKKLLKK